MALTDIIGPVMVGPSSSHTAGAARLGSIARELWGEEVKEVDIYLRGSFAATYWGHGTDKALVGGLMGWYPDDSRIRDAFALAKGSGMKYRFHEELIDGAHPNSVRFVMKSKERKMDVVGASIGGGAIRIQEIDGFPVEIDGDLPTLIIFHKDKPGVVSSITAELFRMHFNIAEMNLKRKARGQDAVMVIEMDTKLDERTLNDLKGLSYAYTRMFFLPSARKDD